VATRALVPFPLPGARALNVLATPAWRGQDRLGELLTAWANGFTPDDDACLFLLADPTVDGAPAAWEQHVVEAAGRAGVALDRLADVSVLDHGLQGDDLRRIHAAMDAYVPIHDACGGHVRLATTVMPIDAAQLSRLKLVRPHAEMGRTWH
jgi:hypothetical protein